MVLNSDKKPANSQPEGLESNPDGRKSVSLEDFIGAAMKVDPKEVDARIKAKRSKKKTPK